MNKVAQVGQAVDYGTVEERVAHATAKVEQGVHQIALSSLDVDAPFIRVWGKRYRRVPRASYAAGLPLHEWSSRRGILKTAQPFAADIGGHSPHLRIQRLSFSVADVGFRRLWKAQEDLSRGARLRTPPPRPLRAVRNDLTLDETQAASRYLRCDFCGITRTPNRLRAVACDWRELTRFTA